MQKLACSIGLCGRRSKGLMPWVTKPIRRCIWWRHKGNNNIVHRVDSPQICGKILVESSHAQLKLCSAIPPLVSPTHYVAQAHPVPVSSIQYSVLSIHKNMWTVWSPPQKIIANHNSPAVPEHPRGSTYPRVHSGPRHYPMRTFSQLVPYPTHKPQLLPRMRPCLRFCIC